ncbi:ABC transporter ATP-binding protein [Caldiplasma sukawensis]
MLEINNLSYFINKKKILDNITLTVKDKSIHGIVGPNGAGKTTLFRTLTGLYRNYNGRIDFNGMDIKKYWRNIAGKIGFMPDQNFFKTDVNIRTFMKYYLSLYNKDFDNKWKDILKLINAMKLEPNVINSKLNRLSYGTKKKIGLIMAISTDPELIILDEPFNGLDIYAQSSLSQIIDENWKDGKTIMISSHALKSLDFICTDFVFLNDGKLLKQMDWKERTSNENSTIVIKIEKADDAIENLLSEIGTWKRVLNTYLLKTEKNAKEIVKLLSQNGIYFSELYVEKEGLEEIFEKLKNKN